MRALLSALLLSVALCGAAVADTVYVTDVLRIGIRADRNMTDKPLEVVKSGTPLQALGTQGPYTQVRAPDGVQGWVASTYVTNEEPPRQQLARVESQLATASAEAQRLRTEAAKLNESNTTISAKLLALSAERDRLKARVKALEPKPKPKPLPGPIPDWAVRTAAIVLLMLLSFTAGVRWYRRRAMKRLGGLRI